MSATDDERLPPGGFSLRHGFPQWFGRRARNVASSSRQTSAQQQPAQTPPRPPRASLSSGGTPNSKNSTDESPGFAETQRKEVSTFEVLQYIRSAFDDEIVLDSIPVEAAGNPGAWHAWRTHRQASGKVFADTATGATKPAGTTEAAPGSNTAVRKPGEWNWEGVWEERVKKGVAASLSDPVLYGGVGAADDVVSLPMQRCPFLHC